MPASGRTNVSDEEGATAAGRQSVSCALREESLNAYSIQIDDKVFDEVRVVLAGRISIDNAARVRRDLVNITEAEPLKNLVVDLSQVDYFDSAAATVLMELVQICRAQNNTFKLANVPARIQSFLELVDFEVRGPTGLLQPRPEPRLLVQIGEGAQRVYATTLDILAFIGAAIEALSRDLARPSHVRWDNVWKLIARAGPDAVPIVTTLSFLMGAILAFQAAIQLRKFGANIFVADLVSLSICLEMGPLMTALIVSGRSGAAYAAQIGTMQVTEEVDALRVMGMDPIRYLVSPRIVAVAFVLPCLTLVADLMGVLGGCLVAVLSLDLTPTGFFNQVHKVLEVTDVLKGLTKSFVFGIEIAMVGCLRGFQVRGGAESVGVYTTSAVVTCIFILTITDAIFAILFYYVPTAW